MKTSLEQQIPFNNVYHFLGARYGRVYRNGNEFWTVGESPRLVALLNGQELILPAVNGTGVVKIPVHKIPEYKKKFFNLYFCQTCMEKRGEGLYRTFFLRVACPSGHSWRLLASTFTWVEVRQQKPPKPQTEKDPEVQFARQDMKETEHFCELYGDFFRRQAREEARRSALKKELQIVQVSKQGASQQEQKESQEEQGPFQHFLNYGVTYVKGRQKYYLTLEQRIKFWSEVLQEPVSISIPAPAVPEINEFGTQETFVPISIGYEEDVWARGRMNLKPNAQRIKQSKVDTGRKFVPWRVERKTKTIRQQSPQPLDAPILQQEKTEQYDNQQISKEEFQKKYQLEDVAELPGGAVKGYRYVSYNGSLVKLTFYSFLFRPSGRGIGEFNPEQVALAVHLANKMGGQVITSDDKKRNIVSLCVLLQDATVVIARRSAGQ